MGYFRRVVLVNSAGYQLADVRLDGHCDIAGGQGAGKTTLMNAILYPFVVDDQYLDIDTREKTRFSLYYFQYSNSFIIYEIVNNVDTPYCVLVHRVGSSLNFHFISAPFDIDWLYSGNEQVTNWMDVRQNLNELGITVRTETTMSRFNHIILGKGEYYNEQYSIVKTPKDRDAVRPLISAIFKLRPFTQETLKETMVAAVMSSNQVETEGIDLSSHRSNLADFTQRYSDIQKMTVKGKNGLTAVDPVAALIFKRVDRYYATKNELKLVPGQLAFSLSSAREESALLSELIAATEKRIMEIDAHHEEKERDFQQQRDAVIAKYSEAKTQLDTIYKIKKKYEDVTVEELVEWIRNKKDHEVELQSLNGRYDAINKNAEDIRKKMELALESSKLIYQNKENIEKKVYLEKREAIRKKKESVMSTAAEERSVINRRYEDLLGADWREAEEELIRRLLSFSERLASAETIREIRLAVEGKDFAGLDAILKEIQSRRCGPIDEAKQRQEMDQVWKDLRETADKKDGLERARSAELASVKEKERSELMLIDEEEKALTEAHNETLHDIVKEFNEKKDEIVNDFNARIHGGDQKLKETLEELQSKIQSEKYILEMIEQFPSAAEDKEAYLDNEEQYRQMLQKANTEKNRLDDEKRVASDAYKEERKSLAARKDTAEKSKLIFDSNFAEGESFLDRKPDFRAAFDACEPIKTDKQVKDIIHVYEELQRVISDLRESIPEAVRRLYTDGMLSRVDTFELGIGYNDSLNTFDDFLSVAERLRTRLENSETDMGIDKFIRTNTNIWIDEIRDISSAMSPVENMLLQIQKFCRKATDFVKKHNRTDCIDRFSMYVDEAETTDIVKLLREISAFYENRSLSLGFDNLFSSEDDSDNKKAIALLEKFSEALDRNGDQQRISLSSMFDIRMDITEKGNTKSKLLSFSKFGSNGTAALLKAMLNMTLLHIFLEKNQAENTRLICAIDEMNTISPSNLHALLEFATAARMYIICSGQNHTTSALDYSYNVYDEPATDGTRIKGVSLDARDVGKEDTALVEQETEGL